MTKYLIKPATDADFAQLGLIHAEGWLASYEHLIPPESLNKYDADYWSKKWQSWLGTDELDVLLAVTDKGDPAGLASFGRLRTPPPGMSPIRPLYSAELYGIYVRPDHWRRSLGTQLLQETVRKLKDRKHSSLCLWVMEKNKNAVHFYKNQGAQKCGKKDVDVEGKTLREIAMGWRSTDEILTL